MELSQTQGDGAPLRTHLQRLYANTRKLDPRLNVQWPRGGRDLWNAFNSISREYGMGGSMPITTWGIESWQRLYHVTLTPWELEMIKVFDNIVLTAAQNDHKETTQ